MRRILLVLALVSSALVGLPAAANAAEEAVQDPIRTEPVTSRLGLVLQEYASFPQSFTDPPLTDQRLNRVARINTIMELPDGSGRKAVPDLNGLLYTVRDGQAPTVYLDVAATFQPEFFSGRGLGQGFGYVAFHPDFQRSGKFYTIHTEEAAITAETPDYQQAGTILYHGVITEWTATDPAADTFAGTHREVLRIGFAGQIHGIQEINFNPTAKRGDRDYGMLYLAVGDGGTGVRTTEPQDLSLPHGKVLRIGFAGQIHGIQEINFNPTAKRGDRDYGMLYLAVGDGGTGVRTTEPQDLSLPHGKVLRIDPLGTNSRNGRYGIPVDNPWVGQAGALGENWAIGFRDPHRFSWDRATGRMYLGHIGEKTIEAIYELKAGTNAGWSEREGWWRFDRAATDPCDRLYPLPADDEQYGYTYPVAAYDHNPAPGWNCTSDVGVAVAGGFVYRGSQIPQLRGKYVFGDLVSGWVFYTEADEMRPGRKPATIHRLHLFDAAGQSVRMQDLSAPGAPGDPNRVDLRFGTDRAGELYILAKANGKVWKVTGTRTFAAGDVGTTRVADTMRPTNWAPVTPSKWRFTGEQVVLAEAGQARPGPRRPYEYAVLTAGPAFSAVEINARVRLDEPVEVTNRDVIIVFGYRSDTEFYYAHLSTDNTTYAHNGIFKVNNADRERIDYQWNGRSRGANPAVVDARWHDVKVRHLPATGEIAVYVDGSRDPLMTARDTTFGSGRVGFGSFDNVGRMRDLRVTGTPAA